MPIERKQSDRQGVARIAVPPPPESGEYLVRIQVAMRDVPGRLAAVAECIGKSGANIVQVGHQRTFTTLPLQQVKAEFTLHTRGHDHVREVIAALEHARYEVRLSEIVQ